jgi:V/A-type H+-transporting ATPase subunit E
MAVDDIIARIQADAREAAERILAEGREEAESVKAEAQAKAEEQKNEFRARAEQRAAEERNRITTLARLSARRELLDAKQVLIDRVFAEAAERIEKMQQKDYQAFVARLLIEQSETGEEEVLVGRNEKRIDQAFLDGVSKEIGKGKGLTLSEERRPIRAGVVLRSGRVETNCALETILRDAREKLETEIASVLFGKDDVG